ncbi:MAG: histidinol-phosphate aminotransferase family protein [Euryarchaeota archaeon]|nr:histidinol-phosphate aminotransferase family protein [Euryarchaeota archaeon]MDE1879767.1 histidinol-phosphate aminotransferase family protein [Euryarchaeota archaeon]
MASSRAGPARGPTATPWQEVRPGLLPPESPVYFDRDPKLLRLDQNTNPLAPSVVKEVARIVERAQLQRYGSARGGRLRKALAERAGLPEDQVIVGNGSDELLDTVARAYLGPGRRAAMYRPGYDLHAFFALREGASVRELLVEPFSTLPPGREGPFVFPDPPGFLEEVDVLFHSAPHNPLGSRLPREQLHRWATALEDGVLVVDEAYAEFCEREPTGPGELWSAGAEHANVFFTRTFSKAWGLAGLRVGWGVAPSPVIGRLERFRIPYTLDSFAEELALAALEDPSFLEESVRRVAVQREVLERGLRERGFRTLPSSANFLFCYPPTDGQKLWEGLRDRGILVRRVSPTPSCRLPLRVTVGLAEDHERLFEALDEVLEAEGTPVPAPTRKRRR